MSFTDLPPDLPDDAEWRDRAAAVIPGGASTGSKQLEALYGDAEAQCPAHYVSAHGCTIATPGGEEYIDCIMALGAVTLGYAEEQVLARVMDAVASGNVAGLSHTMEVEVAERLCDVIPCAEQVRFLKTGAEGVSAAVRVARTYTSRAHVVASGYFGWHDWASDAAGVPDNARRDVTRVPFDDIAALDAAAQSAGNGLAAIVIEPIQERMPSEQWINRARELCTSSGAVLIFDEVKTGFRIKPGGYQELSKIEPDLAVFGKGMSNGFPLAALVGRADVMDAARRTWISSTLAGETIGLAAASAVLDWHEKTDICGKLEELGEAMRGAVRAAVDASGIAGVSVEGLPQMWFLRWEDPVLESQFLTGALGYGVLFKRGAYNFASMAHDEEAVLQIERAASSALVDLSEGIE